MTYFPLCRGYLTDSTAKDPEPFHQMVNRPGDIRSCFGQFSEENFLNKIDQKLQEFAEIQGTSHESFVMSWILAISELRNVYGIPKVCKIIPILSRSTAEKIYMNLGQIVELTSDD